VARQPVGSRTYERSPEVCGLGLMGVGIRCPRVSEESHR
jgi:hypothetical protein